MYSMRKWSCERVNVWPGGFLWRVIAFLVSFAHDLLGVDGLFGRFFGWD